MIYMRKVMLIIGGLFAAIAASACCIIPLILGTASAGSAWFGSALAPYRPYLMLLSIALLGFGFYFSYRPEKIDCDNGCCQSIKVLRYRRLSRILLWGVTIFSVWSMAYPSMTSRVFGKDEIDTHLAKASTIEGRRAVLSIDNSFICTDCLPAMLGVVRKTPGVYSADSSLKSKKIFLQYNPKMVSIKHIESLIEKNGFSVTLVNSENELRGE